MSHPAVDDLLARLRDEGQRITTARRLTLDALVAAGSDHLTADHLTADHLTADHLTADQLAHVVQASHPELHVSTIYRTLEFLEEQGIVTRAGFGDGATTYHLATDHHHHAVCDVCGAVIELPASVFRSLVTRLDKDHGFEAHPRHLTIAGRCRDCRD